MEKNTSCWSVENREAHGSVGELTLVSVEERSGVEYRFYQDGNGAMFYETDAGKKFDEMVKKGKQKRYGKKRACK